MKILVINCYPNTTKGNRSFDDFLSMCRKAIADNADGDDIIIDVKRHTNLEDYIFLPNGWNDGLSPKVKKAAQQVFKDGDRDGSGTIDGYEMFVLMQTLFRKLGIQLRDDMLPLLQSECQAALDVYDDDGSGELDFEEFCLVLSRDPWREMLPSDSRKRENSMRAMRNFCMVDIVLVDGDPYILPWSREGTDLLCLCNQVWHAQRFEGSMNITLLGSAVSTQMMQYLSMIGPTIVGIFNGGGKGERLKPALERLDIEQEAVREGGIFLDNQTGDCYKWDSRKYNPKFPAKAWKVVHNVGVISHANRKEPPRRYDTSETMSDSTKTIVKRDTKAYQHWLFEGMASMQFLAPCSRTWDMEMHVGKNELVALATSMRGVEIVEDFRQRFLGAMFSFTNVFKETRIIVENFIKKKFFDLRTRPDSKGEWYMWMLAGANNGHLNLTFPKALLPYKANKKSKKSNTETDAAEFAQKADAWDMKKSAKTMASLLKGNNARCFETVDVSTGVSTAVLDIGIEEEGSSRRPSRRASAADIGTPASSLRGRPSTANNSSSKWGNARVSNAIGGMSNKLTHRPATAVIKRIQASKNLVKMAAIVSASGAMTKFEAKSLAKERKKQSTRNLTPVKCGPRSSLHKFASTKTLEGGEEASFVPDPYTSDYERISNTAKVGKECWMGDAFLSASGAMDMQGIEYGSTPYTQFSYERAVLPQKWMSRQDFRKGGRRWRPSDGPMIVPPDRIRSQSSCN